MKTKKPHSKKTGPVQKERDPLSLFIQGSRTFVQSSFKSIIGFLVSALLVLGGGLFYVHWQKQSNKNVEDLLYKSRQKLVTAEKQAGGDILSFQSNQNFFNQSKKGDFNKELDNLAMEHANLIKQYISKPSALISAIELSYFLHKYNQPQRAIDLLKLVNAHKKENLSGFLQSLQLGTYLLNQKDWAGAEKQFLFITNSEKAKWLWPRALIKLALSYEGQNKIQQAKEAYKKAKDIDSPHHAQKAKQYLHLLTLNNKLAQTGLNVKSSTEATPLPTEQAKPLPAEQKKTQAVEQVTTLTTEQAKPGQVPPAEQKKPQKVEQVKPLTTEQTKPAQVPPAEQKTLPVEQKNTTKPSMSNKKDEQ